MATPLSSRGADRPWGIVLAGGEGTRLQQFLKNLYGITQPKQYCTLTGTRSMLRHTIDRTRSLIPRERLLTVVTRHHLPYLEGQLEDQPPGTVIVQPCSRETGPGILLPLLEIERRDPAALVAIFPSDHFILNEKRFMEYVAAALGFVISSPEYFVMLGAPPDRPEEEYGWIELGGKSIRHRDVVVYPVKKFWEKPGSETAHALFAKECLWNTLVLVGTVRTFLSRFQSLVPDLFQALRNIQPSLGTRGSADAMGEIFERLPSVNFSRAILERSREKMCVMKLTDVYWSDWGNEYQVRRDVERFGLQPPRGCEEKVTQKGVTT